MRAMQGRVLILGGSAEAFALAEALAERPGVDVISSMAGRTARPKRPAGAVRIGGFGGAEGLGAYLTAQRIDAVVDATHPFAQRISLSAATAAATAGVPIVHLWRPEWRRGPRDRWIEVDSMAEAAAAIPRTASPAFLTIGRSELATFAARSDIHFLARVIDPAPGDEPGAGLPGNFAFVYARGPFRYDDEHAFLLARGVRCIVTKNSGGDGARAKLDAARDLALPVVMVRRPAPPAGPCVANAADAIAWLAGVLVPRAGGAVGGPAEARPRHV